MNETSIITLVAILIGDVVIGLALFFLFNKAMRKAVESGKLKIVP